jgi:signal transduction histidine kinase
MLIPSLPANESPRLQCLRTLQILDTPPDAALDAVTSLLAEQLNCPIALLTLVDDKRQWFKSRHGLATPETPRDQAFCAHAILQHDQFVVPDSHQDERFFDNPLVTGEPRVRFYAGQPLLVEGHAVGTLCVIDHSPRPWTALQAKLLSGMATVVEALLTASLKVRESTLAAARLEDLASAASSNLLWECNGLLHLTWLSTSGEAVFGEGNRAECGQILWDGPPLDALGLPQPDGPSLRAALRAATGPVSGAYEIWTPTGPKLIGVNAVPVVGRGRQQIGWRGVARDVGATVQARLRQRETERADARRREQTEFLMRVSHELRTPLNAILSFNQLLQDELADSLAPYQRRWLELMRQGGQHLLSLTDDLLTLGEREARPLKLAPLALQAALAESVSFIGPLAVESRIELRVEQEEAGLEAIVDRQALHQVLLNVVGNAIKYSPAGSLVRLCVGREGTRAVIDVIDQGAGIPADRLDRLFVPFERLGAEQGFIPGTGLGLAIAKTLVEAMNGQISAGPADTGGCRIRIALPMPAAAPVRAHPSYPAYPACH